MSDYIDRTYACFQCKIYSGHPLIYCVNCPNKVTVVKDYADKLRRDFYDNPEWCDTSGPKGCYKDPPWTEKSKLQHQQIMKVLKYWAECQDYHYDRQDDHKKYVEEINKCVSEYDLQKLMSARIGGKQKYLRISSLIYFIKKAFRLEKIDEEPLSE